jgi:hypothetical protein
MTFYQDSSVVFCANEFPSNIEVKVLYLCQNPMINPKTLDMPQDRSNVSETNKKRI